MARKKHGSEPVAPDAFQQQGTGWVKWLEKNVRLVMIGIGAVLLTVIGVEFAQSQAERSASAQTEEFNDALELYREATDPGLAQTATSTEVIDRKVEAAAAAFAELGEKGGGPARVALLYEADLARRAGDEEKAAQNYVRYIESAEDDDPMLFVALEGAGYAYEALENYDEALKYYRRAAVLDYYELWAMKHEARVLASKGDVEGAREVLEKILETEETGFLKFHAENQLKLLR